MATYQITINERTSEGRNVLDFLQKNKNVKFKQKVKSDSTQMTKAEFYAQIARAHAQVAKGEVTQVKSEDISKYLGLE